MFERVEEQQSEESKIYLATLKQIKEGSFKDLLNSFKEYEKAFEEKERVYYYFAKDSTSEYMDTFRNNLLQHLAGSIIVKEHRLRYQKEQYDRFISSL